MYYYHVLLLKIIIHANTASNAKHSYRNVLLLLLVTHHRHLISTIISTACHLFPTLALHRPHMSSSSASRKRRNLGDFRKALNRKLWHVAGVVVQGMKAARKSTGLRVHLPACPSMVALPVCLMAFFSCLPSRWTCHLVWLSSALTTIDFCGQLCIYLSNLLNAYLHL